MNSHQSGWRSRGYIPHLNSSGGFQSITIRLYDSLPQSVVAAIKSKTALLDRERQAAFADHQLQCWLDSGYGSCLLNINAAATAVENALLYFHPVRYRLEQWCIMPNHLHALIYVERPYSLSSIMQSFKSFSAKEANRALGRHGPFWYPEYFDRYIRTEQHFNAVTHYIKQNPVAAGLCPSPEEWRFSSAWQGRKWQELKGA